MGSFANQDCFVAILGLGDFCIRVMKYLDFSDASFIGLAQNRHSHLAILLSYQLNFQKMPYRLYFLMYSIVLL